MKLEFDSNKLIYLQIAGSIENDILRQVIQEEEQAPSTNQLAALYRINPATAAKGINLLVSEGILYKKRGVGMFVSAGAVEKIRQKRRKAFYTGFIIPLLEEAANLGITKTELTAMLREKRGQ